MESNHCKLVCSHQIAGRQFSGWVSRAAGDDEWDSFLQGSVLGHFQQSGLWAQAKLAEGWDPIRFLLYVDGRLAGGFQLLTRQLRLGKIGYVYKGPVLEPEEPEFLDYLVSKVAEIARSYNLSALIIQPPDASRLNAAVMARHSFLPNHFVDVVSATLLVDLSGGIEDISRRMRGSTRNQVKAARRRGIVIREGNENDISCFFSLMLSTCQRQRTKPVPATESALTAIWQAFRPQGGIRLSIAEYEGEPVAGFLCLCFGNRVTGWKRGWSGAHADRYPSQLLTYEAIEWAHHRGFAFFDFAAMRREIAQAMLKGIPLSGKWEHSRDQFHLGYGTLPKLLPDSQILITNPCIRLVCKAVGRAYCFLARNGIETHIF